MVTSKLGMMTGAASDYRWWTCRLWPSVSLHSLYSIHGYHRARVV